MTLPIPSQRTWAVGDIASAAMLNSNVRDAVNFLTNRPLLQTYQATAQSIPNGTFTDLTFDTNVIDTYNGHSTVTNPNRYTAQLAGWYRVTGQVVFTFNASGVRDVQIAKNGGAFNYSFRNAQAITVTSTVTIVGVSLLVQCAVGDYVTIQAFQTSGAALSTFAGYSLLEAEWVHA